MTSLASLIACSVMLAPAVEAEEGTWAFPGEECASGKQACLGSRAIPIPRYAGPRSNGDAAVRMGTANLGFTTNVLARAMGV